MGEMDYLKKEQESWSKELGIMKKRGKVALPFWILLGCLAAILVSWVIVNIIRDGQIEFLKVADCTPYPGVQIDGIDIGVKEEKFQLPVFIDGKRIYIGESYDNTGVIWEDNLPGICISNAGFGAIICETETGNILISYKLGNGGRSLEKIFQTATEADIIIAYFPYTVCSSLKNPGHSYFYKYDGSLIGTLKMPKTTKIMPTESGLLATDGKIVTAYDIPFQGLKTYVNKAVEHCALYEISTNREAFERYQNAYIKKPAPTEIALEELEETDKLDFEKQATNNENLERSYFLSNLGANYILCYDGNKVNFISYINGRMSLQGSKEVRNLVEKRYTMESNNRYWDHDLFPSEDGIYKWRYNSRDFIFNKIIECKGLKVVPGSYSFFSNGEETYNIDIPSSYYMGEPIRIDIKNPLRSNLRKEIFDDKSIYVVRVIDISP